jgi:hypothetical protein
MSRLTVRLGAFALCCTLVACRDTSLPPAPGPVKPGTLSGRTVSAQPGASSHLPVAHAQVEVLGTGLVTSSDADGYFRLEGLTGSAGQVLFRVDLDGDGHADLQKLVTFAALHAGLGQDVSAGDVVLSENASLHGKVLRGDVTGPTGHAGTLVFVPVGPYTTNTSDDGSFVLNELPEGTLSIAFFRQGYAPRGLDSVTLSNGQALTLDPLTLDPQATPPAAATVDGRVLLSDGTAASGAVLNLRSSTEQRTASAGSDGVFAFNAVPAGLYTLVAHRDGAIDAQFLNLLVVGATLHLPDLVLGPISSGTGGGGGGFVIGGGAGGGGAGGGGGGGALDAGSDAGADAGGLDAGDVDAGADAGSLDAGAPDAGSVDAGDTDAGLPDAGALDAGSQDAGSFDAGSFDAGAPDAGPDAGFYSLPQPPGSVLATLGSSSLDLTWSTPLSNPPVTGFVVRTLPNGTPLTVGGSPYALPVSALVLGTSYTFAVRSVSDAGQSLEVASNTVQYVLPPGAPTNVTAVAGDSLGTVSWTAPTSTGGLPVSGYVITASPGGATATVSGATTSGNVTGLANGTFYSFTVVARNTAGDSAPSSASNTIVPQPGPTLTLTAGGNQSALPNQSLPSTIDFLVKDITGQPMSGVTLNFAVDHGAIVTPSSIVTTASGQVSAQVRLGRAPGLTTLTVTGAGFAPLSVTATVVAPDAGVIYPVENADGRNVSALFGVPGHAGAAAFGTYTVTTAPDGTLYVATNTCGVARIDPAGTASLVAGASACSYTTATPTDVSTRTAVGWAAALVVDVPRNRLYFRANSQYSNRRILALPLDGVTPASLLVGRVTSAGSPTYGDGSSGDQASIESDGAMALSGDGRFLYFSDPSIGRIRRYEFATGQVTTALQAAMQASNCTSVADVPYLLNSATGVVMDHSGSLLFMSLTCGQQSSYRLVRWTPGSNVVQPLSGLVATSSEGAQVRDVIVPYNPQSLALDAADDVFFLDGANRVSRIDATTGLISRVVDVTNANGVAGNYGSATSALVDPVTSLNLDASGTLYVGTATNVRAINGLGSASRQPMAISRASGDGQVSFLTAALSALQVGVQSGAKALSNVPVWFESLTAGSAFPAPGVVRSTVGIAASAPRLGLQPGAQQFRASLRDLYGVDAGSIDLSATALVPDAGVVTTVLNVDHVASTPKTGVPGLSMFAQLTNATGLAVGDGGVIYVGQSHNDFDLLRVDPTGQVRSLRNPGASISGETYTYETSLALDESRNRLYFVANYATVWMIDLTTGVETPWAGGGSVAGPGYGDGSTATAAALGPYYLQLEVAPDGRLFILDFTPHRVRVVDPVTGIITAWSVPAPGGQPTNCGSTLSYSFAYNTSSGARNHFIQFDAAGNGYFAGQYCGSSVSLSAPVWGILKVTTAGAVSEWARLPSGYQLGGLTRDPTSGAVYWTNANNTSGSNLNTELWRIDPTTRVSTMVVGTGASVSALGPDFQAGSATTLFNVHSPAVMPDGRLIWLENQNSIREWW